MSYKTYDEYKEAKMSWVDKIPSTWHMIKAKHCFELSGGYAFKSDDFIEEGIPLVRIGDISNGTVDLDTCKRLPLEYATIMKEFLVETGDILIAMTGATIGKVGQVPESNEKILLNQRVAKLSSKYSNYYKYMLCSDLIKEQILLIAEGSAQENISNEDIGNFEIFDVSDNTKQQIANFLDKKTAKIDTTIAKNKELIRLLEEKRTALINQVVTKGLNPNISMKDSGIEWIGEIPEHWHVLKLKRFVKLHNGKEINNELEPDDENAIGVYGSGGLFKYTDEYLYNGESVLFGRKGTLGKPIYLNDIFWTVDTMYYLSFNKQLIPKYCYYYLTFYPWDKISTETAKPSVVGSDVTNSYFAIPNINEQKQIVNYLDSKIDNIDKIISKINKNINLLDEYKSSLIHHVVTGKIDVRGEEI